MDAAAEQSLLEASRQASAYFDRFDKSSLYHASAHQNVDWLLSESLSSIGFEPQGGLITDLGQPDSTGKYVLLFPKSPASTAKQIRLQEIHQMIRELVEGIYVFNQVPSISLDSNHDCTATVSISSAYTDSLIGEALLSVDYFIKSLLHGSTVAQRDKRARLLDDWKKLPLLNLREEFRAHGMTTMEEDEELGEDLYKKRRPPRVRYPPKCVNTELAHRQLAPRLTTGEDFEQQQAHMSRDIFLQHIDQVSLGLVFRQRKILQKSNIFMLDSVCEVVTGVLAVQQESTESSLSAQLHAYLQKQRDFVSENLYKKTEIARYLDLLNFASFMTYLLVTLKRQNKIIDVNNLLPSRSKDVMRTDRDIPPFLPTSSTHWSPHLNKNSYTGVHGGIHFLKSKLCMEALNISPSEVENIRKLTMSAESADKSMTSLSSMEREIPACEVEGKTYYIIYFDVEPYYSKTPKLPRWVHAMTHELKTQCGRLLQINDARIQDMFRKPLGPRKASSMKTVNVSLQASIENGLLPAVLVLLKRCTQTRLSKPDEKGMTMLHYAAANARPDVISALMKAGSNIQQPVSPQGGANSLSLAIHLAAKTGNVDAVCCLVFFGADLCAHDSEGFAPIHQAAFHNCQIVVRYLADVSLLQIEIETNNKLRATPLLLAAQNGCFDSFKCLTELGANLGKTTSVGSNIVHLAALRHHTGILKFLVQRNDKRANVWEILSEMLKSDGTHAEVAARNLDPLTRWKPEYSNQLLEHNAVESLVQLLKRNETMQQLAIQVLANISNLEGVKSALVKTEVVPLIVKLLSSLNDRIQVCACLVLSDLGVNPETQEAIAAAGAIPHLIKLLLSDIDDTQLFACACIGIIAYDNPKNQSTISGADGLPILVSLLSSPLTCIQGCATSTLQAVLEGNRTNQLTALTEKIISPLVVLLRSKEISIHSNAAKTIESLAANCNECQQELLSDSTCINLLKRLLKMREQRVKVCGGCALWAIAGILISNKRLIATHMGLELLVDMLTIHNEKLDFVCSEALGALATELGDNQNHIIHVGGVKPLVEVLTLQTSQRVRLSVIHTLSALCMKPALVPNPTAQTAIGSSRGIVILSSIVSTKEASEIIRVEAACTLAKLLLHHPGNNKILSRHTNFSFLTIFQFFASSDPLVRLLTGYCLSIMAFNNPVKLKEMKSCGTLNISNFIPFLQSEDQFYQVHSAFQIVVLSQLLTGIRSVDAVVRGLKLLVNLLSSEIEQTKVLSAEFIASLSRSGSGLPGALVMAAALDPLMMNLSVGNGPVIESTCVALGYLTFNPMASRLIIGMFRDNPELFCVFQEYFSLVIFSQKFLSNWNHNTRRGIPSLRY